MTFGPEPAGAGIPSEEVSHEPSNRGFVVETTNFSDKTSDVGAGMQRTTFRGSDDQLRLIERFTRVDPDTMLYEFTVDDPTAFTRPWTAQIPMTRSTSQLFEYACHEGNYAMKGVLAGARGEEKKGEDAARKGSK